MEFVEQNCSNKRPVIAMLVDDNTGFRQDRDGVVSVNDVLQPLIVSVQLESEPASINQLGIGLTVQVTP